MFIVSFNHAFQLKIPSVIIFKIAYVAIHCLEQNTFCTFLPTGHLSFYDPSPHSTNELINVVHLQVQGQKSDFNIVFIGGDGNMHAAARQTLISQGFLQVLTL